MIKIAHLVNLSKPGQGPDLDAALPITLETMRTARVFPPLQDEVSLLAVKYAEDDFSLPGDFKPTPDLERSILDIKNFRVPRKLPLIKDILDRLYENTRADFLIYSDLDMALQPYFYWTVAMLIRQGYDGLLIKGRTISGDHKTVDEIPRMYSELGEVHPGWDCFVFSRNRYPQFQLGTACTGNGWSEKILVANVACLARKFKMFEDLHLTFHMGNEQPSKKDHYREYLDHNRRECRKILQHFERKFGPFDPQKIPGCFLNLSEIPQENAQP